MTYAPLTDADFATLDRDSDGFLSLAELQAQLEPGSGCCEAGKAQGALQHYLGDFLLLGLALMTLFGWSALARKN